MSVVAVLGEGPVACALRVLLAERGEPSVGEEALAGGRLDGLFLGLPELPAGGAAELEPAAFGEALERGVHGPFRQLGRALPLLVASGGSVVVEVSAGAYAAAAQAAADATVSPARVALARVAALEYGADGVRTNALLVAESELAPVPVSPEDAAQAAWRLLAGELPGVNGAVVAVDGAVTAVAILPVVVADAAV